MLSRNRSAALPDVRALFAPLAGYGRIGLAVSGGPDSLALMLLAAEWAAHSGAALFVYTLDHGLRAGSAREAAYVKQEAERLGLTVRLLRWDGPKPETGVQAAAREARYRLIGSAMRADGAEILVTAHHAQDQAETVLMRLAHGSGIGGLGAMDVFGCVAGVPVCRPLLGVAPETLAAAAAAHGLVPADDPGNADPEYERVRWRRTLPMLADLGLDAGRLGLFARRARRADAALAALAGDTFDALATIDRFGVVRLAASGFAAASAEVQVRLVRMALDAAGGGQRPFALGQVEDLAERLAGAPDFAPFTLMGCVVARDETHIAFTREAARIAAEPLTVPPGATCDWDGRFAVTNTTAAPVTVAAARLSRAAAEAALGTAAEAPMAAVRAAPLVRAADGAVLALGATRAESLVVVRPLGPARK